jgi:hypothetical protein
MYSSFAKNNAELTKNRWSNKMQDVMYHLNGTGRDTYIFNNNGGFAVPHRNGCTGLESGKMLDNNLRRSWEKFPNLCPGMPKRYFANGTGRDTYISSSNGGFSVQGQLNNRESTKLFVSNLRDYERDGEYLARRMRKTQSGFKVSALQS